LFLIEYSKDVDDVMIGVFHESLSIGVDMNDTFPLSRFIDPNEDKGVVVGCGKAKNLFSLLL
jgi:hypothetical protein